VFRSVRSFETVFRTIRDDCRSRIAQDHFTLAANGAERIAPVSVRPMECPLGTRASRPLENHAGLQARAPGKHRQRETALPHRRSRIDPTETMVHYPEPSAFIEARGRDSFAQTHQGRTAE